MTNISRIDELERLWNWTAQCVDKADIRQEIKKRLNELRSAEVGVSNDRSVDCPECGEGENLTDPDEVCGQCGSEPGYDPTTNERVCVRCDVEADLVSGGGPNDGLRLDGERTRDTSDRAVESAGMTEDDDRSQPDACAACGSFDVWQIASSLSGLLRCNECDHVGLPKVGDSPEHGAKPKEGINVALQMLSDEDLQILSDQCHGVSPRTHSLGACLSALNGIEVDREIARRDIKRLKKRRESNDRTGGSENG